MPASRSTFRWCETRGLGEVEQRHELADADLARVLAQHVDELEADRIAEGLGHSAIRSACSRSTSG